CLSGRLLNASRTSSAGEDGLRAQPSELWAYAGRPLRTIRKIAQNVAAEPRDKVGPERREPEKLQRKGKNTLTRALPQNHSQLDRKFSIFQPVITLLFCDPSIGIADVQHTARI